MLTQLQETDISAFKPVTLLAQLLCSGITPQCQKLQLSQFYILINQKAPHMPEETAENCNQTNMPAREAAGSCYILQVPTAAESCYLCNETSKNKNKIAHAAAVYCYIWAPTYL